MKKIISVTLGLLMALCIPTVTMAETPNLSKIPVERIAGYDKYDTAIAVADKVAYCVNNGGQFSSIVLASGNEWQDAIAGAPFAANLRTALLLVDTDASGSQKTINYLKMHLAKSNPIYILGGTGVIHSSVEDAFRAEGYTNIQRIAGEDASETSLKIAKKLPDPSHVTLIGCKEFYDALNILPESCSRLPSQDPVLVVDEDKGMSTDMREYLDTPAPGNRKRPVLTAGKLSNVIKSIYSGAGTSSLLGQNIYETNMNYLRNDVRDSILYVVNDENYQDALTVCVLAGLQGGKGVIITPKDKIQPETLTALHRIAYYGHSPERWPSSGSWVFPRLEILGGSAVISDNVVKQMRTVLAGNGSMDGMD